MRPASWHMCRVLQLKGVTHLCRSSCTRQEGRSDAESCCVSAHAHNASQALSLRHDWFLHVSRHLQGTMLTSTRHRAPASTTATAIARKGYSTAIRHRPNDTAIDASHVLSAILGQEARSRSVAILGTLSCYSQSCRLPTACMIRLTVVGLTGLCFPGKNFL